MKWFIKCLRLYAVFKGRARRSEYGYFLLFNTVFGNMASLLLLVRLCTDSSPGANRYGPNPKEIGE